MHYYLQHTPNYFHLYGWLNDITREGAYKYAENVA